MKREITAPADVCLSAVVLMFACAENGTEPGADTTGDELNSDAQVTQALAQMDAGASAASQSASSGGTSGTAPAPQGGQKADPCAFDDASKSFKCPQTTAPNGMKQDLYFQLLDAAGESRRPSSTRVRRLASGASRTASAH